MPKIFVSYKYNDSSVLPLENIVNTRAKDYVNILQSYLDENDQIYKGENDDESLESFKDSTIESKLKGKIYDSTVTLVMISKNMKEDWRTEEDQWIPWEISYSLKELSRDGRTSKTNAVAAVVLPDENGSYEYFIQDDTCPNCHCRMFNTGRLFRIIKNNLFNHKSLEEVNCGNHALSKVYSGNHSYIHVVKWSHFIADLKGHISTVMEIKENIDKYDIQKIV